MGKDENGRGKKYKVMYKDKVINNVIMWAFSDESDGHGIGDDITINDVNYLIFVVNMRLVVEEGDIRKEFKIWENKEVNREVDYIIEEYLIIKFLGQ